MYQLSHRGRAASECVRSSGDWPLRLAAYLSCWHCSLFVANGRVGLLFDRLWCSHCIARHKRWSERCGHSRVLGEAPTLLPKPSYPRPYVHEAPTLSEMFLPTCRSITSGLIIPEHPTRQLELRVFILCETTNQGVVLTAVLLCSTVVLV